MRSEIVKIVFGHVNTFRFIACAFALGKKYVLFLLNSQVLCAAFALRMFLLIRQQLGVVVWHVQFKASTLGSYSHQANIAVTKLIMN